MRLGVVYLLTAMPLAARLVVSLYSLRKWYDGPVTVFTTRPQSHEIGRLMAEDSRLNIQTEQLKERRGQGPVSSYLTKIDAARSSPYEATVFLDADTLIVGSVAELLRSAEQAAVTATQFCETTTADESIAYRLRRWKRLRSGVARELGTERLIDIQLATPFPAVNTGVFSVQRDTALFKEWDALARQGRHLPLPDELAFQILLLRHQHHILGGHFNCHPCFANIPDVRIWHFVAATHLEYTVTQDAWLPMYRECQQLNVARITSWSRIDRQLSYDVHLGNEGGTATEIRNDVPARISRREEFSTFLNKHKLTGEAAEIGVARGEFARLFLDRWHGRRLHLIDPWRRLPNYVDVANVTDEEHEANLAETINRLTPHRDRICVHRACSHEAVRSFADNSLDFVYVDANHAYTSVREDLRLWYRKVRPGGILAGHDFVDGNFPQGEFGVASAVREFAKEVEAIVGLTLEREWRSWYLQKLQDP